MRQYWPCGMREHLLLSLPPGPVRSHDRKAGITGLSVRISINHRIEPTKTGRVVCWNEQLYTLFLSEVLAGAALADSATSRKYTPVPYTPGWEIWVGAAAGAIPFFIGSWEFGKRIVSPQVPP